MSGKEAIPKTATYSASLVTQGQHRFYTLTIPSEILAASATVDTRAENPLSGFQRRLDVKRADEIARYIDKDFGTIPTSIILSAQPEAELAYTRERRSITFKITPRSFLILDGQHRVYGFARAESTLRVPVVIYNGLSRSQECRLFMDINTKQRPVPNELLLDIKRLAETETDDESLLGAIFDLFYEEPSSPLTGRLSPSARTRGKLSRVTFYAALRPELGAFGSVGAKEAYEILAAYLHVWSQFLQSVEADQAIVNPIVFKAIILLFHDIAERVSLRHGSKYTVQNFRDALEPLLKELRPSRLKNPGKSHHQLHDELTRALRKNFSLAGD